MRLASTLVTVVALLSTLNCGRKDSEDEDEDEKVVLVGATACGVEREAVKVGTDTTSNLVNLTTMDTTIANLRALPAPTTIPASTRIPNSAETQLWRVSGTLTVYKLETDSDFHLVLSDASGATMIVEIPSPGCDSGSVWTTQIANSRSEFTSKFTPTSSFQTANIPVVVTGVGMFDFAHGQTGAAPNQIELHPVFDVCFVGGSTNCTAPTPDFSLSANPTSLTTADGASSTSALAVAGSGGFTGSVALAASGVPSGASSSFSSTSVAAGGQSTLTLSAGTAAPGVYPVTIAGTSGSLSHSTTINWTVTAGSGGGSGSGSGGGSGSGSGSGGSCPASYTLKFNGHSYRPVVTSTYANVVSSCHADGEHVVVINSSAENTFVMNNLTSSNSFVWIGLQFSTTSKSYVWDDGTSLGTGFEAFTNGVPTNPTTTCVDAHQTDDSWSSFSCTASHPSMCECDGP